MVNLVQETQENKKRILLSTMYGWLAIIAALPLFIISGLAQIDTWMRIVLILSGSVVVIIGIAIACILDRTAGAFECSECKKRFVPDMKEYVMAPHTITRRKLKCPECGAHKFCKKVLTK